MIFGNGMVGLVRGNARNTRVTEKLAGAAPKSKPSSERI
jgi:hypothetical protein